MAPPSSSAPVALIFPEVRVAAVPLSVKVKRVLGDPSASLIVKTPSTPVVARVRVGAAFERVIGAAPERVRTPEPVISVAPAIAPALVIPPELLLRPPVIDAPPDETVSKPPMVCAVVKLLFWPLYATLESVPVVLMLVPLSWNAEVALMFATVRVALVPLSTSVSRVLGETSASLIDKVLLTPVVAKVTI